MPKLDGSVENIVFRNEDNHYTVARFRLNSSGRLFRDDLTTIVGTLPGVHPGELLTVEGEWEHDPRYGKQLRVVSFVQRLPSTTEGMIRYLSSGLIKGIGPKKAKLIVEHFGEQTLAILEQMPERLSEVRGLGVKDRQQIVKTWIEQGEIKELHLFLQSHDVSINVATRIYKHYGQDSIRVIRENPYQLVQEVEGIGFRMADEIALKLGMPVDSEPRLAVGLKYVLTQAANEDGHCFLHERELVTRGAEMLHVSAEAIMAVLEQMRHDPDIFTEVDSEGEPCIYYAPFWYAESGAARLLRILQQSPDTLPPAPETLWERVFERLKERRILLTEKQRLAVQTAYTQKVSILTGGPGTGKTTSIRALLMFLRSRRVDFALAAPTGRAAKRLSEATGMQGTPYAAKTLHRLLEYTPHDNSYQRNEEHPLPYQFVIVDEFSMVDILLFYHLLKALPRTAHLLLVGDADQLPSVGPGNVLRDLLRSEDVPSIRLTELFRQAQQSKIIVNAHRINGGLLPSTRIEARSDFFFMAEEDPVRAQKLILDLVQRRLPARYGFHPLTDIQVLSPMYRGAVGVHLLNEKLQERLNTSALAEVGWGEKLFRVGDKVMQTRNNYDKGVFNGDVGWIRSINRDTSTVKVEFVEEAGPLFVSYAFHELEELVLAYAVTVHKSQGSEYPAIIVPLFREHRMLLQRNLLYTAITRAKRFCVLVGQPTALELAVQNDRVIQRNTALMERLRRLRQGVEHVQ
ncbi:exodeoxyribonuclease V alpha subunit [Thermosporothrix hazakensis]|jgi:exodeoxyribonuclease V alpha subunit|uniref:ATP-dependent RecD2 DNA helicase n=1 Tax=Thermosporothrix hazakensis TaxID=644383 RepID=A0A326U8N7_THEHA|nr:ATP-dependent RecD-like DNA helicase [Thermosporothrix hazakensis]PZW30546.1 exodeoxyribonuclease V alpha subunit [Thermosporothrix hazakensis]GCE49407.1 ATP-dependent RecD-like DNA helicase [Thermosporothrix hazakensis]